VLNEFPITTVPGGMQVALGDSFGGERRRVVSMLRLKPQADEGTLQVAELLIRYAAVGEDVALHTITLPVVVQVGGNADDVVPDPEVTEQVLLLQAAQQRKEAARLADEGNFGTAAAMMRTAATTLESLGLPEADELLTDVRRLESHTWDRASSKKHFSANRAAQKSRRLRFDEVTDPDAVDPDDES